jgi:hypothetical protein
MKSTLASIQLLIEPLIDRATKQVHSVAPMATMLVYENTFPVLRIEEAATGDFISILPATTSGCAGAASLFLVVDASSSVTVTQTLTPGVYKICHALQSFGSNTLQNYWEQSATLTVEKNPFSDLSVVNSARAKIQKGVRVSLNVSGRATEGGFVAFVATNAVGCTGAESATRVVAAEHSTNVTFSTAGKVKVCYAAGSTGGDETNDYSELGVIFEILNRTVNLNIPNASSSFISANTSVYIEIDSSDLVEDGVVAMVSTGSIGCQSHENYEAFNVGSVGGTFTTPLLPVGVYRVCYSSIDTGLEMTVGQPSVSSMVPIAARSLGGNKQEYRLIRGAALYATVGDSVEVNGSVSVLKNSSKNCVGAAANAVLVSSGMVLNIPSDKIPKITGRYKVCYAPNNENNTVAPLDIMYVSQPLQLFVTNPEIAVVSSRLTDTTMVLTVSGIPDPARLAFMPAETLGCTGANAYHGVTYAHNYEDNFVVVEWTQAYGDQKKMCYALESTDGTSDEHYVDQGYLYGYNDPQITVDDSFTSGTASFPVGLARDDSSGNLFVSSLTDNKVYKVTPSGIQTEFYTGLSGPFGIDVDSVSGDVYVCEVNGQQVRRISQSGSAVVYATGISSPAGLTRDTSTGVLYVTEHIAEGGKVKKVFPNRTVVSLTTQTFNRPRGITLRQGTSDLYFISGDTGTAGSSIVHHLDANTGAVTNITSFGTLYDIHAPPSESYIFVTNFETQSIFRVASDGKVFNFANYWKDFNTDSGVKRLSALTPYALTRDDASGTFYLTNYWYTLGSDSSSKYYNQVNDNVVKVTDNRFSTAHTRRRLSLNNSPGTASLLRTPNRATTQLPRNGIASLAQTIHSAGLQNIATSVKPRIGRTKKESGSSV